MADLPLYPDEAFIQDCDTAFFNGNTFPPRGRLVLTNFRVIYMMIHMDAPSAFSRDPSIRVSFVPEVEIPLSSIEDAQPTRRRGNPFCMKFTLLDGTEYTFAANKKWQEAFYTLPRKL
jgi:hypothetical protein